MSTVRQVRRLLLVLELLQSGRELNSKDLSEIAGVSRRTILRDIQVLQKTGLPIDWNASRNAYRMTAFVSIPVDLTFPELENLALLSQELSSRAHGIECFANLNETSHKLIAGLPPQRSAEVERVNKSVRLLVGDGSKILSDNSNIQLILKSIRERRKMRIAYKVAISHRPVQTLVSPYLLAHRSNIWLLFGRSSLHRSTRMFCVSHIHKASLTDDLFDLPSRKMKALGNDRWNTCSQKPNKEEVVVSFAPLVAHSVSAAVAHLDVELKENLDGSLEMRVTPGNLHEFSWWVLRWGDQATVIEPKVLVDVLRYRIARLSERYSPP